MNFRPAPLDSFAKYLTIIIIGVMVVSLFFPLINADYLYPSLMMFAILLISVLVSFSLRPKTFTLNKNILLIEKSFGNKVELSNILSAEKVIANGVRTGGVGGLFGYFGYFNGNDVWCVTNKKKAVKLITEEKTYFISPDNPSEFIHNFELENNL